MSLPWFREPQPTFESLNQHTRALIFTRELQSTFENLIRNVKTKTFLTYFNNK